MCYLIYDLFKLGIDISINMKYNANLIRLLQYTIKVFKYHLNIIPLNNHYLDKQMS